MRTTAHSRRTRTDRVIAAWMASFGSCVALLAGCASWTDRGEFAIGEASVKVSAGDAAPSYGGKRMHPLESRSGAIILEVEFVDVPLPGEGVAVAASSGSQDAPDVEPHDEAPASIDLWRWVDETPMPPAARAAWSKNGMRIGRLQNAERFRRELARLREPTVDVVDTFLENAEVAGSASGNVRRIPVRPGQRYELPLHEPLVGTNVVLIRTGSETIGRTLGEPQLVFGITPLIGNSLQEVEFQIAPEIQHGAMRQSFVSSDAALRIDMRRETWKLDELTVATRLGEGSTLVVGTTEPSVGLGARMLHTGSPDHRSHRIFALIRLARVPTAADRL